MVVAEGAAALGVLKSAYEFVRDLRKSNDPSVLKAGVEELTDRLLSAREDALKHAEAYDVLVTENKRLRAELDKRGAWEGESAKYQLVELHPGSFAYALRPEKRQGETDHNVCATCFKAEKITILQKAGSIDLKCPVCETRVQFQEPKKYSAAPGRGGPGSWMGS